MQILECETGMTADMDKCTTRTQMEQEGEMGLAVNERVYEDVADYVVRLHPFSLKNNVAYASTSSKVGALKITDMQ